MAASLFTAIHAETLLDASRVVSAALRSSALSRRTAEGLVILQAAAGVLSDQLVPLGVLAA